MDLKLQEALILKTEMEPMSGCWLWTGAAGKVYGVYCGKLVHRTAWKAFNGDIPQGLLVCHKCDTPLCINPRHLFIGTNLDNTRDKIAKGRARYLRGSEHGIAKLTEDQVLRIRNDSRLPYKVIASDFGVSDSLVGLIKRRKSWAWL